MSKEIQMLSAVKPEENEIPKVVATKEASTLDLYEKLPSDDEADDEEYHSVL